HYDATADVLVAATIGRGAWRVNDASKTLPVAPSVTINGTEGVDEFTISIDPANPRMVAVKIENFEVIQQSFQSDLAAHINVNGDKGNDSLTLDGTKGLFETKIFFDGGPDNDLIQFNGVSDNG